MCPVIYTVHGLHLHKYEFSNQAIDRLRYKARYHLEKRLFKKADQVIAVSKEDLDFMEMEYELNNVVYITNGISSQGLESSVSSKKDLRITLSLPEDSFIFTTVARFNFQKGYDILIRAIQLLKEEIRHQKICFMFVGRGPEYQNMIDLSLELGVKPFIQFMGQRSDVYDILRSSDVCVLPSRWEGLPIVLLEAGYLRIPVLATNTYGNREIIGRNNGILVQNEDPADLARKMRQIVNGEYNLLKYSDNLFEEVRQNYSLHHMITALKQIYLG